MVALEEAFKGSLMVGKVPACVLDVYKRQDTVDLIRQVEFTSLYTFIYSPRVGTRAAKMDDPIPAEEKTRWFQELCAEQERIAASRCAATVGTIQRVLVEEQNEKTGLLTGRTDGNVVVDFPCLLYTSTTGGQRESGRVILPSMAS